MVKDGVVIDPTEPNITAQLIAVQSKLKAPKSEFNSFGGYNYRSAEDILEAVKPLLLQEQLALTIVDEVVNLSDRFYIKATAYITNTTGQMAQATAFAREPEAQKGMNEAQITGSASSYARKYALNGLFAIDDTQDADATNTPQSAPKNATAPTAGLLPATAKQKQAIFTLLTTMHIPKTEQKQYLVDNFNVGEELDIQLASDIISALKAEVENGN